MDSSPPASIEERYLDAARALARVGVNGQHTRIRVTGQSMLPVLRAGDVVIAQAVQPAQARRGDVLVVQSGGDWVTHRLVHLSAAAVHLRGDALTAADQSVPLDAIVGRVSAIERDERRIDWQARRWRVANRLAGAIGFTHYRWSAGLRRGAPARGWRRWLIAGAGRLARFATQLVLRLALWAEYKGI